MKLKIEYTEEDLARLVEQDLLKRFPGQVVAHEMPHVGHWLHTEDPEGTFALLARHLGG